MMYPAGEKFQYNNTGYVVLGLIIEKLTGQLFDEYLEKNIFEPCGMWSTGYYELDRLPGNCANSYIYDKEGLLKPSEKSEGGRRLYTKKDMVKLHQIISLKYLGFSLDEIKGKLFSLDNPKKVAEILKKQIEIIKKQIKNLKSALDITEALSSHMRERFKDKEEEGLKIFEKYSDILDKAVLLKEEGELPTNDRSIALGKEWWDMINEFTGGDMSLIPKLMEFNENKDHWNDEMARKQKFVDDFIGQSIEAYFKNQNIIIPEMEGNYEK